MSGSDHWFYRPMRRVHQTDLQLPGDVAVAVRSMADSAHPFETGGLLLGWWEGQVPNVCAVVEVPDQGAGRTRWHRNERAAATALATAIRAAGNSDIGYVGDWHSHPANIGPSGRDLNELRSISHQYSHALVLAVVRHMGPIDTRLARGGSLTTLRGLDSPARFANRPSTTDHLGDEHAVRPQ